MALMPSDARLARRASDGDERAFAAIFRRYHQELYRFCLSILGRPEDAQEALQNTMVKALRSLPGEEREIRLKPWLYRVAHNESIDLLRRRREGPDIEAVQARSPTELTETVEMRARLSRLLADLGELPDRQRSALTMRELAGLSYEQIGEAFGTSVGVARQTVYEARLGLRELEAGREMRCEEVTHHLSDADGRVLRRRDIQAHLRSCAECRAFRDAIPRRRDDFAALAPLPAMAAAAILHGAGGSAAAGSGLGGGTGATVAGATAGKAAVTSVALKAAATVAVVAAVGVSAADRGGVVDLGLPGGNSSQVSTDDTEAAGDDGSAGAAPAKAGGVDEQTAAARHGHRGAGVGGATELSHAPGGSQDSSRAGDAGGGDLPAASAHGQETAAAHKGRGTGNPGHEAAAAHHKAHGAKGSKGGRNHGASGRNPQGHGKSQSHAPAATGKPAEAGNGSAKPKPTPDSSAGGGSPPPPPDTVTKPSGTQASGAAAGSGGEEEEASP